MSPKEYLEGLTNPTSPNVVSNFSHLVESKRFVVSEVTFQVYFRHIQIAHTQQYAEKIRSLIWRSWAKMQKVLRTKGDTTKNSDLESLTGDLLSSNPKERPDSSQALTRLEEFLKKV